MTREDARQYIERVRWTFARTMPWSPHEYTVRSPIWRTTSTPSSCSSGARGTCATGRPPAALLLDLSSNLRWKHSRVLVSFQLDSVAPDEAGSRIPEWMQQSRGAGETDGAHPTRKRRSGRMNVADRAVGYDGGGRVGCVRAGLGRAVGGHDGPGSPFNPNEGMHLSRSRPRRNRDTGCACSPAGRSSEHERSGPDDACCCYAKRRDVDGCRE